MKTMIFVLIVALLPATPLFTSRCQIDQWELISDLSHPERLFGIEP